MRVRHRLRAQCGLLLIGAALLVAGCGGGSSLGVDSISGLHMAGRHGSSSGLGGGRVRFFGYAPSPAQRANADVAGLLFSRCMRAHGVPNFPDPSPNGGIQFGGGSVGLDYAAPLFRRAQRSCFSVLSRRRGGI